MVDEDIERLIDELCHARERVESIQQELACAGVTLETQLDGTVRWWRT